MLWWPIEILFALVFLLVIAVTGYRIFVLRRDVYEFADVWPHGMDDAEIAEHVQQLLSHMSLREKVAQLSGDGGIGVLPKLGFYVLLLKRFPNIYSGYNRRLAIPPLSFTDGPRGIVMGRSTCFPVAMARGASWDVALEQRVGEVFGREACARGANYFAGLCVNLLRHPAWGRAQETYGEDSFHLAAMGIALMRGVQKQGVMVCAKHFAVNSIENSRFYLDVRLDDKTLHEVYLPHFRKLVDAGVDSLMSAYNQVNGVYCGHNAVLLDEILRKQWGFRGFVSSDWLWGIYEAVAPITAGMDVEMPYARFYGRHLRKAVQRSAVNVSLIDQRVARVLHTKLRWLSHLPASVQHAVNESDTAHQLLAQEAAEQSMVLLKNTGNFLPLQKSTVVKLAVIGELAAMPCLGDNGSSRVSPPFCTTFLQGIQQYVGANLQVLYCDGKDVQEAVKLAAQSDAVVLVAGCYADDEGENLTSNRQPVKNPAVPRGGDRISLTLCAEQEALIAAVSAAQQKTVVAVVAGSAVIMENWREKVPAILYVWYAGMAGGHALARVLFGDVNPSGKMPFTIPQSVDQLPPFDCWSAQVRYDYFHGYRLLDRNDQQPAFPFGFGLSYTQFLLSNCQLVDEQVDASGILTVSVSIKNTGDYAGAEVLQCYIGAQNIIDSTTPIKSLCGFEKIFLQAGEERVVTFTVSLSEVARYEVEIGNFKVSPGDYRVWVGNSAHVEGAGLPFTVR